MKYFKKTAAGPVTYKMTSMDILTNPNLSGKYVRPQELQANRSMAKLLDPTLRSLKKGLIILRPADSFKFGPNSKISGKQAADILRKHEMTHYLRDKKGLLNNVGKKNIRGIFSTIREEGAAQFRSMKGLKMSKAKKAGSAVAGVIGSLKYLYPKDIIKSLLKFR